ncbi:hypothetical protein M427DRAFT_469856 [Gonapodya prolifera JEL478]|uniref:Uncharacterized protein n=1 Tax=Gonapodya prolifera (strain JEL478) TaxID=1344416 RepID=A0A139AQW6_GONPJ|nr:hypothetical protein M427DRAFT_469856 [Gonapodya prolifera JEL478]|eukprot:KXS19147.1 hypothetical protein M427DRAFT_469856 [Gonapodya prolifera JEL478]
MKYFCQILLLLSWPAIIVSSPRWNSSPQNHLSTSSLGCNRRMNISNGIASSANSHLLLWHEERESQQSDAFGGAKLDDKLLIKDPVGLNWRFKSRGSLQSLLPQVGIADPPSFPVEVESFTLMFMSHSLINTDSSTRSIPGRDTFAAMMTPLVSSGDVGLHAIVEWRDRHVHGKAHLEKGDLTMRRLCRFVNYLLPEIVCCGCENFHGSDQTTDSSAILFLSPPRREPAHSISLFIPEGRYASRIFASLVQITQLGT